MSETWREIIFEHYFCLAVILAGFIEKIYPFVFKNQEDRPLLGPLKNPDTEEISPGLTGVLDSWWTTMKKLNWELVSVTRAEYFSSFTFFSQVDCININSVVVPKVMNIFNSIPERCCDFRLPLHLIFIYISKDLKWFCSR